MKSIWSVPLALALAIAGSSLAGAQQQQYPRQFADQWMNSCLSSCQGNTLYKGREGVCSAYCTCIVQEAQANVPLEVALQADKDLAAKKSDTEAVQRVSQVTSQCQSRYAPPQQSQRPARQRQGTSQPRQ